MCLYWGIIHSLKHCALSLLYSCQSISVLLLIFVKIIVHVACICLKLNCFTPECVIADYLIDIIWIVLATSWLQKSSIFHFTFIFLSNRSSPLFVLILLLCIFYQTNLYVMKYVHFYFHILLFLLLFSRWVHLDLGFDLSLKYSLNVIVSSFNFRLIVIKLFHIVD